MENVFHSRDGAQTTNRKTRKKERKKKNPSGSFAYVRESSDTCGFFFMIFLLFLVTGVGGSGHVTFPFHYEGTCEKNRFSFSSTPEKEKRGGQVWTDTFRMAIKPEFPSLLSFLGCDWHLREKGKGPFSLFLMDVSGGRQWQPFSTGPMLICCSNWKKKKILSLNQMPSGMMVQHNVQRSQ